MTLDTLAELVINKADEFERLAIHEGSKLKLNEILKNIEFSPTKYERSEFKDGQELELTINNKCYYYARINKEKLVLKVSSSTFNGNHNIKIAEFEGNKVKGFYNSLSKAIQKAQEDYLDNLPF